MEAGNKKLTVVSHWVVATAKTKLTQTNICTEWILILGLLPGQDIEHYQCQKCPRVPPILYSSSSRRYVSWQYHKKIQLSELHIHLITQYVFPRVWFLLLTIVIARFLHVTMCSSISFTFTALFWSIPLYKYTIICLIKFLLLCRSSEMEIIIPTRNFAVSVFPV